MSDVRDPEAAKHYDNSYRVYLKKCGDIDDVTLRCLQQRLPAVLEKLNKPATNTEPFRVLGVGSGDGRFDIAILETITDFSTQKAQAEKAVICQSVVDPSELLLSEFRKAITTSPESGLQNKADVEFDFKQITIQEYLHQSRNHALPAFELIHFIRSLYFVDLNSDLPRCYDELLHKDRGVILCVLRSSEQLAYQTLQKLSSLQCNTNSFNNVILCSDNVVEAAKKQNWNVERYPFSYSVDVTDIFTEDSMDGNMLLDFLTLQANFRKTASKETVEQIEDFIAQQVSVDGQSGQRLGQCGNELIIIYKGFKEEMMKK